MKRRHAPRDEAAFTIVELLIVIVVESLIVGGLGSAFVLIMNNSTSVKESLARTGDARLAASYIVSDAGSSSGPETSLSDTTSCPDANPPVAGSATAVVRFNWNSTSSTGTTTANIANYVLVSSSLLRRFCQNGSLVTDEVLAANVTSATATCSPNANCTGTPTTITATLTETQGSAGGPPYQYSLTGAFRKAIFVGSALPSSNLSQLVALGAGGCGPGATGIRISGGGTRLGVHGDAFVNTADGSTCTAMSMATGSIYAATGATKILTGGSCAASGGSVCPTTTSYSPAIADPYSGLTAPSTAGLPSRSGCAGGTAQPGVYAGTLSISGGSSCTLASGVYILQNGLTVATNSNLTSDSAGVLLYVTGGSISVSGGSSVTLAAMTSGTYSGMVMWQAGADTSTITFATSAQLAFTGAMYAPAAQLTVSGGVQASVTTLVGKNFVIATVASLLVGTPLSISSPVSVPASTVNRPYPSTTIVGAGGNGSYSWSASGLPAGLTMNSSTGVISGTPTSAVSPNATITLNDAFGDPATTKQYTVMINAAPSITTTSPLTAGEQTVAYSTTLAKSGGTAPFTWSATSVPAGLSIDSSTGVISGTPTTAGTSSVSVTLTDAAGGTVTKSLSITVNPTPTITSVALSNGGATQGKLEKNDTIVVTFSAQMSVSSFCSTWSGDGSNQSLNANNDVTVTVNDGTGATNDSISVTSGTCSFQFGSIDLGSNAYVSGGAATFGGTGSGNKSTIAWTQSTHTLTITLGPLIAGTVATVASSTPIYTAHGSIQDSAGAGLTNSPFTLATAKQF